MSAQPVGIGRTALASYLASVFRVPVEILGFRRLGETGGHTDDPKEFGYGVPFEVSCLAGGVPQTLVISRTRPAQGFGHDYPADRAWQAIYGHEAYNSFPAHVRSLDVGVIMESGALVSLAEATEFFQLVEKAEGALYWLDLRRLMEEPVRPLDVERAVTLGRFLAETHATKRDERTLYERRIRELIAHGECLMGILDSYPHPYPLLPPRDCEHMEQAAVAWRWRLRGKAHRLSRVHGDFHPWNILFRSGTEFSLLDRSRGEWGEPADDVAALAINYVFFGLRASEGRKGAGIADPFLSLFWSFMESYLGRSGDQELLRVLPPFLAFRATVIAHPRWYPTIADSTRVALLNGARTLMASRDLDLDAVDRLFGGGA